MNKIGIFAAFLIATSCLCAKTGFAQPITTTSPQKVIAEDNTASDEKGVQEEKKIAPDTVKHPEAVQGSGTLKPFVEEDFESKDIETETNTEDETDSDSAHMPDVKQTRERQTIEDVDFGTIESFGTPQQDIGAQTYSYAKRSVVTALVKAMPQSDWYVLNDLTNQILFSDAKTSTLEDDAPAQPKQGQDLLSLRIEKMFARGLIRQAYDYYTRLDVAPYNEKLARLGIISMLINNQKPLACIEAKIILPQFEQFPFWRELDAYCSVTVTDDASSQQAGILQASESSILKKLVFEKNYTFHYTPSAFESLSPYERGLLIAENKLIIGALSSGAAFRAIPASHVQALLAVPSLDNKTRILLNARGLEANVIAPSDLKYAYTKIGRKAEKEKTPLSGFEHIANTYWKRADTFLPEERQASLSEIFGAADQYGYALLVPFLEEISKFNPQDQFTIPQAYMVVRAYLSAGDPIPVSWLEKIKALSPKNAKETGMKTRAMIAAALLSSDKDNSAPALADTYKSLSESGNITLKNMQEIVENIDSRTENKDKVADIYEKGFDLPVNKGYIMPPEFLLNQLRESSANHAINETVLLSNIMLKGVHYNSVNITTLGHAAFALKKVGLGRQAQRLVAETILETK